MEDKRRKYLTLRQGCIRLGNEKLYYRIRRIFNAAFESKQYGDRIINATNGKSNRGLLIEEQTFWEILGGLR